MSRPDPPKREDIPDDVSTGDVLFELRQLIYDVRDEIDWIKKARAVTRASLIIVPTVLVIVGIYVSATT